VCADWAHGCQGMDDPRRFNPSDVGRAADHSPRTPSPTTPPLGAVLVGQDVAGWIIGLVVGLTSLILAALLWSARQL
jgi:hypothetical protein